MIDVALRAAYEPGGRPGETCRPGRSKGSSRGSVWTGEEVVVLIANRSDASYPPGEAVACRTTAPGATPGRTLPPTGRRRDGACSRLGRRARSSPSTTRCGPPLRPRRRVGGASSRACRSASTNVARRWSAPRHRPGHPLLRLRGSAPTTDSGRSLRRSRPSVGHLVATRRHVLGWSSSDESNFPDAPGTTFQSYTAPTVPTTTSHSSPACRSAPCCSSSPATPASRAPGCEEEAGGLVTGLTFTIESGDVDVRPHLHLCGAPVRGPDTQRRLGESTPSSSHIPLTQVDVGPGPGARRPVARRPHRRRGAHPPRGDNV